MRGNVSDCMFGWNNQSWNLNCFKDGYSVTQATRHTSPTSRDGSSPSRGRETRS